MKTILVVFIALAGGISYGFKIGTHVWIAQETINNLQACKQKSGRACIGISTPETKYDKEIEIPDEVAQAILEYPEFYRNGNIGPDAYPDILVGQTVIHPGITHEHKGVVTAKGFGTGEFLALFLRKASEVKNTEERKQALAFAYGMLGHAASDTFAHSYVNAYAGDEFLLSDGENDVERRHIALEDYINQKTPSLNKPHKLLERNGKLAIPADLIREVLVYSKEIVEQYGKSPSTTGHLVLVRNLREEILRNLKMKDPDMDRVEFAKRIAKRYWETYGASALTGTSKDGKTPFEQFINRTAKDWPGGNVQDAEILAIQILAYYYLGLSLDQEEAAYVAKMANQIHEYTTKAPEQIARANEKINKQVGKLLEFQNRTLGNVNQAFVKQLQELSRYSSKVIEERNRLETILSKISDNKVRKANEEKRKLCERFNNAVCDIPEVRGPVLKCPSCKGLPKKVCKKLCDTVEGIIHAADTDKLCLDRYNLCEADYHAHNRALADFQRARQDLLNKERQARRAIDDFEKKVLWYAKRIDAGAQRIHAQLMEEFKRRQAMESDIGAAIVRLSHGHREQLNLWVRDIDNAVKEWVIANGRAMQNTMDNDPGTSFWAPLSDWKTCYLPSLLGVPQEVSQVTICAVNNLSRDFKREYEKLVQEVEEIVRTIDPKIAGRLLDARDHYLNEGPYMLAKALNEPFKQIIGTDKYELVLTLHIASNKVTREILNDTFSGDGSGKHLIKFPKGEGNIADRVDAEMHLIDGKFDPDKYAPVANARNLSALSLLDSRGIKILAEGTPVEKLDVGNLITSSVRSIDGSFQWMEVAPPFPRAESASRDARWAASCKDRSNVARRYGYGFPLFEDNVAKQEVFDQVFIGPLNSGISDIVPNDYPYQPSEKDPFPKISSCDF